MKLRATFTLFFSLLFFLTNGQIHTPVTWHVDYTHLEGDRYKLVFSAEIDKGWAVYSQYLESDEGPVATTINYSDPDGFESLAEAVESGKKKEGFDDLFEMNVIKFMEEYVIEQELRAQPNTSIAGYINYMTCDDVRCLPPTDVDFELKLSPAIENTVGDQETTTESPPAKFELEESNTADPFGSVEGVTGQETSDAILEPVKWSASYDKSKDEVVFSAKIQDGWHIYGQEMEGDGPIPTEFWIGEEKIIPEMIAADVVKEKDDFFDGILVTKVKHEADFRYSVAHLNGPVSGEVTFMACDVSKCIFPLPVSFELDPQQQIVTMDGQELSEVNLESGLFPLPVIELDKPVVDCGDIVTANVKSKSLWNIFLLGGIGGLLALFTPCVFPMIPLTVSFFTKGSENKRRGVHRAVLYGFFILLVYLVLSIPFHLLDSVNPGILNDISTNVWLNIAFFLIFLFFAFSFFGYYELTIPSRWTNRVSNAESVGGVIGIFFMALTLALVSFSCTGPILGSLLAGALTSEGGAMQLTAGMGGFGLALALPFALFAAFPSWLSGLPKSGGWLNTVKVTLGFLELAAAFKFLSNADLVTRWGLLKIEPFLIIWIIIFVALGLYLFGRLKFPHDSPVRKLSFLRGSTGILSMAFAVYLASGFMVDEERGSFRSLKLLSGLAPPAGYSWLYPKKCPNNLDCFKDLSEGVAYSKKVNKPMMIDFTGHACVNCRKMEEHVWPKEGINEKLRDDFVLISLYVDEKIDLPEEERTKKMRNYGHKWAAFQAQYFNNNSQPYYVLLSPDGKLLNNPVGYTPDADEYAAFLECGLEAFEEMDNSSAIGLR
ncbi:MAG: thioredoxin fold domain-containing protein [Saprospiraceae bacterium]|nr:thioredoxin fold domain-containing protein [Saprospiraceae bacterium]